MMTHPNWLVEFQQELNLRRSCCAKHVWFVSSRLGDLPPKKAALGAKSALLLRVVSVAAGHGGFVGGGDFVGGAILADLASIDPDDAVAEAANLVELMGDEDDSAAGAGDVAHFAEAFFLEIDVADGEDFVDEKD